jgi:pimeloyl-ACP methyl ester carboxylesterase
MRKYPYNLDEYNIQERRMATNGIELNVFEAGSGPLVFLLHGFPECWASWGPQITHLVDRGYRVVAPEMRGYGGSDAPENVEAYDTLELAADVAGLIDAYGGEPAVVIGHDWGCIVAWHVAWLYPEKLAGVGGLSVPWFGRGEANLLEVVRSVIPDNYFYINEFERTETSDFLNSNHQETLYTFMCGEIDLLDQFDDGRTLLERIKMPETPPDFMPRDLLDYLQNRFSFNGFDPALNWYRNFQRSFERTEGMGENLEPPAMYLTGSHDWPHDLAGLMGVSEIERFNDLRVTDMIEAGHWLSQEKPDWVNQNIDKFMGSINY